MVEPPRLLLLCLHGLNLVKQSTPIFLGCFEGLSKDKREFHLTRKAFFDIYLWNYEAQVLHDYCRRASEDFLDLVAIVCALDEQVV